MNLTPNLLINRNLFKEQKLPSISISLLNNQFEITGISKDGLISGKSFYEIKNSYLIIENIPSPELIEIPTLTNFWDCFWYTEKAFKALRLDDWEAFGINIDKSYGIERFILKSNKICDLAYSSARVAGAFGGYPNDNKLFLVCNSDKKDIIKKSVENAIRNIS